MKRAVFLDRDGVINRVVFRDGKGASPRTLDDFELLPGVDEAARLIKEAGYYVFVVTNQPDIARKKMSSEDLSEMNARVQTSVAPAEIAVCPHDDHHRCTCRKPKPGMLLDLAERWDIDLAKSWLVGDSYKDMDAGRAARVTTVLIRRPDNRDTHGDLEVDSLLEAARRIVAVGREESPS